MARTTTDDTRKPYTLGERARAFVRGLPELEPMVSVAREGLLKDNLGQDQRLNYALRVAESRSSGCSAIAGLIRTISTAPATGPGASGPYRSAELRVPIPPHIQERLCDLYRTRYDEAMASFLSEERIAADTGSASRIVNARIASRMDKARAAYDLLKGDAITSQAARRHLAAVFCDGARDVLAGGLVLGEDAGMILEAVVREFHGEGIRGIIPNGLSPYECGRILSIISERLCGADMSFIPPKR